jgi:hypothetical protein
VKYFLTFPNTGSAWDVDGKVYNPRLGNSSHHTDLPAHTCICPDDFEPELFENFPSRELALGSFNEPCKCVDCIDNNTASVCIFFFEDIKGEESVHFQTFDAMSNGPQRLLRRKRGLLKRFFDRIGGGLSLKHNQESRADMNLGINEDMRPGSGNLDSPPASTPTATTKTK